MSEAKQALVVYQELEKPSFLKELAKAIPNTLKPERMVRLAYTLLRNNEALQKCSVTSIMAGVVESAQLGLELDSVIGHAYLVPFAGEATLIIGYKGFAHLMYQSGSVVGISAEIVREGDRFSRVLGTDRRLVHVPAPIPTKKNGEPDDPESRWVGAYAAVKFVSGATDFEYMEKSLIYSIRSRSRSYQKHLKDGKQSPWVTYPDVISMWTKTPMRRMAKRMPTSTTDQRAPLVRAAMIDEYGDRKGLLIPTLGGYQVNDNPPDEDPDAGAEVQPTREVIDVSPGAAAPQGVDEAAKAPRTPSSASSKPPKKQTAPKPAPPKKSGLVPPAQIPKDPIPVKNSAAVKNEAPKSPAADPVITPTEQSDLYNRAVQAGWKIDEFRAALTKRFKVDSVKLLRQSQLGAARQLAESGT